MTTSLPDRVVTAINRLAQKTPTWLVYLALALPAPWLFYQGLTGGLGVEPIKALEHEYGELALQLLIAGLCITPLMRVAKIRLIRFRRAVGLMAFFNLTCHLLVWLVLDVQVLAQIWQDILKRPYITVGMIGFVMLVPLAVTSNQWSIRKLGGARWRSLHKLVYPAVLLGVIHNIMVQKVWETEPLVYLAVLVGLMVMRVNPRALPRFAAQSR